MKEVEAAVYKGSHGISDVLPKQAGILESAPFLSEQVISAYTPNHAVGNTDVTWICTIPIWQINALIVPTQMSRWYHFFRHIMRYPPSWFRHTYRNYSVLAPGVRRQGLGSQIDDVCIPCSQSQQSAVKIELALLAAPEGSPLQCLRYLVVWQTYQL